LLYGTTRALSRRRFLYLAAAGGAAAAWEGWNGSAWAQDAAKKRRNVLFIAADDLRPTLGCYGDPLVQSPNIDRMAADGMVFQRAYCQQAVCSPSRNGVLTGLRPDTIGIYDLPTHFRTKLPDVVTLPQHFQENGYHTERMGKIFHTAHGNYDDRRSWTVSPGPFGPPPETEDRTEAASRRQQPPRPQQRPNGPPTGMPDVEDNALGDGKMTDRAVERLRELAKGEKPFFLALGYHKPHLPFIAPKRYWDRYDPAKFTLEPLKNLPEGAPPYAGQGAGELRTYAGVPKQGPIPDDMARRLLHGYYACISYIDALIGRVLDELDRLGLKDDTIVILWGDHGWHLGDHGMWAKHTNFEQATNAPIIVRAPDQKKKGRTDALVEFVDMYPSLCELAGLTPPKGLEGTSFVPLLDDPKRPWKSAVFHLWPKTVQGRKGMGRSLRTDRYRLTEWTFEGFPEDTTIELYDYRDDPRETANLATKPENEKLVRELRDRLAAGWKSALPPGAR
jgi:iduronate 2-sulfatase